METSLSYTSLAEDMKLITDKQRKLKFKQGALELQGSDTVCCTTMQTNVKNKYVRHKFLAQPFGHEFHADYETS